MSVIVGGLVRGEGGGMCECEEVCLCRSCRFLMLCAGTQGGVYFNTVDIFNATSGTWSTAALSVVRDALAATSLPNHGLAIFAGGVSA